jgi:tetratricopeptide (TPR) repeat protein
LNKHEGDTTIMMEAEHGSFRSGEATFIGRIDERQRLQDAISRSLQGSSTFIVLKGEAGIGKTRLGDVLEVGADSASFLVLRGNCLPGASIPHLPINEIAMGLGLPPLTFFDEMTDGRVCPEDPDDRRRGSENYSAMFLERLEAVAREQNILIRIEDMQWCDTASLKMLGLVGMTLSRMGAILCMTVRPEDLAGRGEDFLNGYRAMEDVLRMQMDSSIEIALKGLNQEETSALIGTLMPAGTAQALLDRVARRSEGVPLFAVEMARYLREMEVFTGKGPDQGAFSELELPRTVIEVIKRRLDSLSTADKVLVEWAVTLGPNVDLGLLKICTGLDESQLDGHLANLVDRCMLLERSGNQVRFYHARIMEVTSASISKGRARGMHRKAGEAMETSVREGDDLLVLSDHFFIANVPEKASSYAMRAGRHLIDNFAALEALSYFQRALDLGASGPQYLQAWEGIGDCREEMSQYREAADAYGLSLEHSVGLDQVRLLWKLANCYHLNRLGNGTWDQALSYLEEAMGRPELPPHYQGEILSNMAMIRFVQGDRATACALSGKAVVLFRECGNPPREAWELVNLANYGEQGDGICRSILQMYTAAEIYERHPWPRGEAICYSSLSLISLQQGRYEDALAESARGLKSAIRSQDWYMACMMRLNLSLALAHLHRNDDAFDELAHAIEEADRDQLSRLSALFHTIRSWYLEIDGDLEGAEGDITTAEGILAPLPRRKVAYGLLSLVRGRLEMESGNEGGLLKVSSGLEDIEGGLFASFYGARWEEWLGDWCLQHDRVEEGSVHLHRAADKYQEMYDFDSILRTWRKVRAL